MRAAIFGLTFLAFAAVISCATIGGEQNGNEQIVVDTPYKNAAGTPVLVELFTSEGCSSCPPADRVLATIARDQGVGDAKVITLAFHVDYWDYLGWKDRFSSAAYSARQQEYARQFRLDSSYTPQMVVDGATQFVGSNRMQAIDAIAKNAKQPKPEIDLKLNDGELAVRIANLSTHGSSTVYLAIAENGLSTRVKAGENSGKTYRRCANSSNLAIFPRARLRLTISENFRQILSGNRRIFNM